MAGTPAVGDWPHKPAMEGSTPSPATNTGV